MSELGDKFISKTTVMLECICVALILSPPKLPPHENNGDDESAQREAKFKWGTNELHNAAMTHVASVKADRAMIADSIHAEDDLIKKRIAIAKKWPPLKKVVDALEVSKEHAALEALDDEDEFMSDPE